MSIEGESQRDDLRNQAFHEICEMMPIGSRALIEIEPLSFYNREIAGGIRLYITGHFSFPQESETGISEKDRVAGHYYTYGYRIKDSKVIAGVTITDIVKGSEDVHILCRLDDVYLRFENRFYKIKATIIQKDDYGYYVDIIRSRLPVEIDNVTYENSFPDEFIHTTIISRGLCGLVRRKFEISVTFIPDKPWTYYLHVNRYEPDYYSLFHHILCFHFLSNSLIRRSNTK